MTARAPLRQADLSRLMRAAKRAGVIAEIDMGGAVIRILPDSPTATRSEGLDKQPSSGSPYRLGPLAEDGEENW